MKAIFTKYHGPTTYKGSRVSATDRDGNRVIIEWDDALNDDGNHDEAVRALCVKMGWTGRLARGWDCGAGRGGVYVWCDRSWDRITVK